MANGSHTNLHSHSNGDIDSDDSNDHLESLSDTPSNGLIDETMKILSNEQISMECDSKSKPIATQSCTTGIECSTVINDNIDSSSHEEADRITNASSENENEDEDKDENEDVNENENENTGMDNGNDNDYTNSETDNAEGETSVEITNENDEEDADGNTENAGVEGSADVGGGGGGKSEESEETEVFRLLNIQFCSIGLYDFVHAFEF